MYATYRDKAHVFVVYIREAHPTDGWQTQANVREGILIADPTTQAERDEVAREFASQFKVSLPILVDTIDNEVERAYSAIPDRIYIIDARGKIAYKGGPGPRGFKVAEVPPLLDRLLGVQLASKADVQEVKPEPAPRPGAQDSPEISNERLARMLERLGVEEKVSKQAMAAVDRKRQAYRDVMTTRGRLMFAVRGEGNAAKALAAYEAAQQKYVEAVARIDKDLDEAIGYSKNPEVRATLTVLGVLGVPISPPGSMVPGPAARGGFGPAGKPGRAGQGRPFDQ